MYIIERSIHGQNRGKQNYIMCILLRLVIVVHYDIIIKLIQLAQSVDKGWRVQVISITVSRPAYNREVPSAQENIITQ